jgi:hypothetical protein
MTPAIIAFVAEKWLAALAELPVPAGAVPSVGTTQCVEIGVTLVASIT